MMAIPSLNVSSSRYAKSMGNIRLAALRTLLVSQKCLAHVACASPTCRFALLSSSHTGFDDSIPVPRGLNMQICLKIREHLQIIVLHDSNSARRRAVPFCRAQSLSCLSQIEGRRCAHICGPSMTLTSPSLGLAAAKSSWIP